MAKNCILISSYGEHFCYLLRFLYTIRLTPNNIPIYVIVNEKEKEKFKKIETMNSMVHIISFSHIVHMLDGDVPEEDKLLDKIGKYNYQSLKKYYGIYYLFFSGTYENIIIFDSETMIIREIDIDAVIEQYLLHPFLIYSEHTGATKSLHDDVVRNTQMLLKTNDKHWFLEYYLWIYEKNIFMNFMCHFVSKYDKSMISLLSECDDMFIENLYQSFICKNESMHKYELINIDDLSSAICEPQNIKMYKDLVSPQKILEDCRLLVDKGEANFVKKMYDRMNLQFYKASDTKNSRMFVNDFENIKICVSEFSKQIFTEYHKDYIKSICVESKFKLENITELGEHLYSIKKSTNTVEPFNWIGYEMMTYDDVMVKFSFELFFKSLDSKRREYYIGFKNHYPLTTRKIDLSNIPVGDWIHYDFDVRVKNNVSDLYIIIFDNAPKCEVLIRNFAFDIYDIYA